MHANNKIVNYTTSMYFFGIIGTSWVKLESDVFFREGMMSYKQFIQELEDDILPSEAERR